MTKVVECSLADSVPISDMFDTLDTITMRGVLRLGLTRRIDVLAAPWYQMNNRHGHMQLSRFWFRDDKLFKIHPALYNDKP